MSLKPIQQSILPLVLATFFIGLFYLQFVYFYPFIIENFRETPLFWLYAHLFLYLFLAMALFTTLINLLNHFIIKSNIFVVVSITTLILFYLLLYPTLSDVVNYFLDYRVSDRTIMEMILFVVTTLGYTLYSLVTSLFRSPIPLSHVAIFSLLTLLYSGFFIDTYCYPIEEFVNRF